MNFVFDRRSVQVVEASKLESDCDEVVDCVVSDTSAAADYDTVNVNPNVAKDERGRVMYTESSLSMMLFESGTLCNIKCVDTIELLIKRKESNVDSTLDARYQTASNRRWLPYFMSNLSRCSFLLFFPPEVLFFPSDGCGIPGMSRGDQTAVGTKGCDLDRGILPRGRYQRFGAKRREEKHEKQSTSFERRIAI